MKSNRIIIIVLLSIMFSFAQVDEYIFKQLTDADGLSQSTIFSTIQDRIGYLWFGTIDGLNRYDGYEFKVYSNNPADSTSISDNFVSALFEDRDGTIWVGTVNGYLNKFNRKTETFKRYYVDNFLQTIKEPVSSFYDYPLAFSRNQSNTVTSIEQDKNGYLWIGTWGNGIIKFNIKSEEGIHVYNDPSDSSSLSSNTISDILIDSNNEIWIATFGHSLNKLIAAPHKDNVDSTKYLFLRYCHHKANKFSLSDDKVICLFEDNRNNLWAGTFSGGLNKLDYKNKILLPNEARFIRHKQQDENEFSLSENTVMDIEQGPNNNLWVGTFGGGLNQLDIRSQKFTHYSKLVNDHNSFPENEILSLFVDRSGILWVGSHLGEGVTKIQKNTAKFELRNGESSGYPKINDNVIWSVFKDSKNNYWIGTYKGGVNFSNQENGSYKVFKNDPQNANSISDNHIRSIAEDNQGNIWVGTYSGGLNKINPVSGKINVYKNSNEMTSSISANQVLDIYVESDSVLWLATFGGGLNKMRLVKNNNPEFYAFKRNPDQEGTLSDNRVYTLLRDSKDNFWVGTYGGGLNKFDESTGKFRVFQNDPENPKSIADNKILSLLEDSNGNLWIGTSGGGLNKFNYTDQTFKRYSTKHGLTSAVIYGILEDANNNLWLSSDNGIYKFNQNIEKFVQFGIEDGLQSLEFNGGSYFKDSDGIIYFGGINGLNFFNPDSITINSYIPPIVISSIKILDNEVKGEPQELVLSYDENFISFEFSSLDFSRPQRNKYRYILEGFQKHWMLTDASRRVATYTNLPAGEYEFKVTGTNSDGIWNESGASIKIFVNPPFWQTWWFATLAILLVGFLLYYLSTVRIKNQLAIERIKTKIASDLHDNVGAGLTEISILSELAVHKKSIASNSFSELKKISDTARELVDNMSDIVWVVNPQRDSLHDLIIKIKDSYNEFFSSVGISFKVKNVEKSNDIKLPMEYKQNLLMIFKEAINNAIKHSKGEKISLEAMVRNDNIEIYVLDDGIGFDHSNIKYGNGMKNMLNRAKKIGGEIILSSGPGEGTKVLFTGKISKLNKLKSFFNI